MEGMFFSCALSCENRLDQLNRAYKGVGEVFNNQITVIGVHYERQTGRTRM